MKRILFVCTGNICRSPTAEGVFRARALEAGLDLTIDSAGTHNYHVGDAPDPRSIAHAHSRGYDISTLKARRVKASDFHEFDMIYALDSGHMEHLRAMMPKNATAKLALLLEDDDVPDPYYGSAKGFEEVLDLVEAACDRILSVLRATK